MCRIAFSCILAAVFSLTSDVLLFGSFAMFRNKSTQHGDWETFKQLDPEFIQSDWEVRRDQFGLEVTAGLFNAMSWVILCIPLIQVTWMLSRNGSHLIGLHAAIAVLALMGTNAEFISHSMSVGAFTAMDWLSKDFNLEVWLESSTLADPDNVGWRTLEVIFLSIQGMTVWVEAIEHLFLAFILFLMYLSIQRQDFATGKKPLFSITFGGYGLFLSITCLIEFTFEILRFKSWMTYAKLAFFVSVVMRVILWPAWLLLLGRQLANANVRNESQQLSTVDTIAPSMPSATTSPDEGEDTKELS